MMTTECRGMTGSRLWSGAVIALGALCAVSALGHGTVRAQELTFTSLAAR
jgi:hypothetical protein